MRSLRRIAAILLRQYYLIASSPARLLPLFVWAAVDIVLWGFITRYLNTVASSGINFIPALLGAVLFWDFFSRVMFGVTTTFLEDVWSRNFLNLFATPLSISEYLGGLVLSSIATSTVGLVVMLVLAMIAFGLSFAVYGLALIPFLLVLFLYGIALGVLAAAFVLRYGPAAEWFTWPMPAVLSPFAAVTHSRRCRAGCSLSRACCRHRTFSSPCEQFLPAVPSGGRACCGAYLWPCCTSCWPAGSSLTSTVAPYAPA
jgi:ABC-2 type transport system permease protein